MKSLGWNDSTIASLKQRWDEGKSVSLIAQELGKTRNAVLGKVHRLGLSSRRIESEDSKIMRERRRQEAKARRSLREINLPPKPEPAMLPEENVKELPELKIVAGATRIPFRDLAPLSSRNINQCRYIADEPAAPDYIACGNPTAPGESYCSGCKAIVYYRPPSLTAEDRARRSIHGSKLWRPKTVAGVDISGEAA